MACVRHPRARRVGGGRLQTTPAPGARRRGAAQKQPTAPTTSRGALARRYGRPMACSSRGGDVGQRQRRVRAHGQIRRICGVWGPLPAGGGGSGGRVAEPPYSSRFSVPCRGGRQGGSIVVSRGAPWYFVVHERVGADGRADVYGSRYRGPLCTSGCRGRSESYAPTSGVLTIGCAPSRSRSPLTTAPPSRARPLPAARVGGRW